MSSVITSQFRRSFLCASLIFRGNFISSSCLLTSASGRGHSGVGEIGQFLNAAVQVMLVTLVLVSTSSLLIFTGSRLQREQGSG